MEQVNKNMFNGHGQFLLHIAIAGIVFSGISLYSATIGAIGLTVTLLYTIRKWYHDELRWSKLKHK